MQYAMHIYACITISYFCITVNKSIARRMRVECVLKNIRKWDETRCEIFLWGSIKRKYLFNSRGSHKTKKMYVLSNLFVICAVEMEIEITPFFFKMYNSL